MESLLVGAFANTSSINTGENLWRSRAKNNNITYASSYVPKALQHKRKTLNDEYNLLGLRRPCLNNIIEGGSAYQEDNRKYIVKATSGSSFKAELDPHASDNPKIILHYVQKFLAVMYKFCYPHLIAIRTMCTVSACLIAVEKLSDLSPLFFISLLKANVPYVLMDIYANGVNQLFDVEIDKINKPYLPLASGELSFTIAVIITASSLILSFWVSWIIGSWPLIWSLLSIFAVWSAYAVNVPFLRWKRHPVLALMCVISSWIALFPIGPFFHIQTFVFKRAATFSRSMMFNIVFMSFYSVGVGLFKDIGDIEGDKAYGIYSFAARLGPKQVFWICVSFCEMAFGVGLLMGATAPSLWSKIVSCLGHAVLASIFWYNAKSVDLSSKASITSFYMFIWKILSAEFLLMPLVLR